MMLVFDHVCVFYGDTPVLRELSFQIRSGEQVGLIRPARPVSYTHLTLPTT